jgi:hypothetical protein
MGAMPCQRSTNPFDALALHADPAVHAALPLRPVDIAGANRRF